jgi:CheY-like chemotaxis protein
VLDLMLPGMSGIEVLDVLRGEPELSSIPVIVVTAWSHAEASALVAGADRFVPKPFDPVALETAVEELLQ